MTCNHLVRLESQANQGDGTPLIGSTAPVTNTGSAQNRPTPYQRVVQLQTPCESGVESSRSSRSTSTRRVQPPSMFKPKHGRKASSPRLTSYVRDIMCLPRDSKTDHEKVVIPRGTRRTFIGENGVVGKIRFTSLLSAEN